MQQVLNYPTESQIMTLQPQDFVNIRQNQEQINLLRRIAKTISEDSSRSICSVSEGVRGPPPALFGKIKINRKIKIYSNISIKKFFIF